MNEKAVIESTYYHTCDILRRIENEWLKDGYQASDIEELIYADVRCAVSFHTGVTGGSTDNLETVQPIEYIAKLFIGKEYQVKPGDIIVADVEGQSYEFRTGEGASYKYHQEIPLMRRTVA